MENNSGKLIYQETFPYVKFITEEISEDILEEFIKLIESETGYSLYKKEICFKDTKKTEQITALKNTEIIGAIDLEELPRLTDTSFINITVFYKPDSEGKKFCEKVKKFFIKKSVPKKHIQFLFYQSFSSSVEFLVSDKKFIENINPELFYGIDADRLAEAFLNSNQNLLIFYGKPGTGKSKLIQYILGKSLDIFDKRIKVLVIKGLENIRSSADRIEIYLTNDIVIFDDFDCPSFKRGENDEISNIVSTILSATDGFIPKKPKIIISTNTPFREIDSALTRPSRLFDILEIKPIPKEFFFKLAEKYPKLSSAKVLYDKEKEIEIAKIFDFLSRNNPEKSYLKDKRISKREHSINRKMGF